MRAVMLVLSGVILLSACSNTDHKAEAKMEKEAKVSATAAGTEEAALGLSEAQLLDADLVDAQNKEIGDVVKVVREANGNVEKLLVKVEDSRPNRFVYVAIADLKPVINGSDTDLSTSMTKQQLASLPAVKLSAQ